MNREHRPEDYLWDRSGPRDPQVARLEQALGTLRHRREERDAAADSPPAARPGLRWKWIAAAVAAVLVVGVALRWPSRPPEVQLRLPGGALLAEAQWLDAERETSIELDRYGELTLAPGSRMRVDRLDRKVTSLFLQRGQLDAFVGPEARARFFQVGTPSTRCVDIGCQYTLTVDDEGAAEVRVSLGQVAFEDTDGREVLVLRGALCRARPGFGAGTPRYLDSPAELQLALDRFDVAEAPAERSRWAEKALAALASAELLDAALPAWHLMADPDPRVARGAVRLAEERFGAPDGLSSGGGEVPSAADLGIWKEHLGLGW